MTSAITAGCSKFGSRLPHFLDNGLVEKEREVLEAHLRTCKACRCVVEEIRMVSSMLHSLRVDRDMEEPRVHPKEAFLDWQKLREEARKTSESASCHRDLDHFLSLGTQQRFKLLKLATHDSQVKLRQLALARADRLSPIDPLRARDAAKAAVDVSLFIFDSGKDKADSFHSQLEVSRAYASLGNTRRLSSDFGGAESALSQGFSNLPEDNRASEVKAKLLSYLGSLRATQSRFSEAISSFDGAIAIHRMLKDPCEVGRDLLGKGLALSDDGAVAEAIACIRSALGHLSKCSNRRLLLVAKHNLVYNLRAAGQYDEAIRLMAETRALHRELGNAVDLARLRWLEGQIALEQDDLGNAESAFNEVKAFFIEKGVAHDTALVSLDLATVYLNQGRLPELKALSVEMLTIFDGVGTRRESRAALTFFEKAIELERAQVEMVRELLEYLSRIRFEERTSARLSVPT